MNTRQDVTVKRRVLICSVLFFAFVIALIAKGPNAYASDTFDLYDAIPIYADGTEGEVVHAVQITNSEDVMAIQRTIELVQLPENTVQIRFYGGDASKFWQPIDGNCSQGDVVFTKESYSENGWWTINVSELSFNVKTSWYNNTLSQDKTYYIKQADYYELTNRKGNNNTITHFFVQIGDADSPLDVLSHNIKDGVGEWSKKSYREDNSIDLNLSVGKRNESIESAQEIYYTIDGSDPTSSSTANRYSEIELTSDDPDDPNAGSSRKITIAQSCTIQAASRTSDGRWGRISQFKCTVNAPMPTFSPAGGWYTGTQNVSIESESDDDEIYYTTDGSNPVDDDGNLISTELIYKYDGPITVSGDQTIKAVVKKGQLVSMVAAAEYNLSTGIDIEFNGNDQGVWLFKDTINTKVFQLEREGTIVTPYGHSKCSVIISAAEEVTLKLADREILRETSGEYAGKFVLDLDVRENAADNDQGAKNVITVTNGNKSTTYTIYCIASIYDDVPDKVVDYFIPASQYTNHGVYGTMPNRTLIGKPLVQHGSSLGNFGGYITWYYKDGISNDPNNPYGVDFIVFNNSFDGSNEAAEPGNILVSEDGTDWYILAGSIHYDGNVIWNQEVTYTNSNGFAQYDFKGRSSGVSRFAYPDEYFYPLHASLDTEDFVSFATKGTLLIPDPELNEYGNIRPPYPAFGYADTGLSESCSNEAVNPYTGIVVNAYYGNRVTTNRNGDACDIAWAVDEDGFPVHLDTIHYVKVQTASYIDNGAIGEKSTEVNTMRKAKMADTPVGVTSAPKSIRIDGAEVELNPGEVTDAYVEGIFDIIVDAPADTNVYINSLRSHTAFMDKAPHGIVRVLVQEGEKEPRIYYFRINQSMQPSSREITKITFLTTVGDYKNLNGLLHDKDELTNYYDADTIKHFGSDVVFDEANQAKDTQSFVWWQDDEGIIYDKYNDVMAEASGEITLIGVFYKKTDIAAADNAKALIEAIPDAHELTLEDADAVKAAQGAYDALTDEQKRLISNEDKMKLALASAVIGKLKAEDRAETAESTVESLQEQLAQKQNELTVANNRVTELQGNVSTLETQLTEAQLAVAEAEARYNALKTESDTDKTELAQAKTDLANAKAAEKEAKDNLDAAKADFAIAQSKVTELEGKVSNLEKDLDDEKAKAVAAQDDAEKYEEELAILKAQNAILKKTVKKVKAKAKKKSALVSWKSTGKGFKYEVYRSTNPTKSFKKVKTVKKLKVTVKKLKKGKTYYFKVRAFKKVGGKKVYTGYSNIAKVKIKK